MCIFARQPQELSCSCFRECTTPLCLAENPQPLGWVGVLCALEGIKRGVRQTQQPEPSSPKETHLTHKPPSTRKEASPQNWPKSCSPHRAGGEASNKGKVPACLPASPTAPPQKR